MYSGVAKLCHDSCTTGICRSTGRSIGKKVEALGVFWGAGVPRCHTYICSVQLRQKGGMGSRDGQCIKLMPMHYQCIDFPKPMLMPMHVNNFALDQC